jgi:glucose/arabinose dehydrogenase
MWKGHLIIGALGGMQVSRVQFDWNNLELRREAMLLDLRQRIRDVREGPDGFLYLTTDMRDGAVLKLEPAAAAATVR